MRNSSGSERDSQNASDVGVFRSIDAILPIRPTGPDAGDPGRAIGSRECGRGCTVRDFMCAQRAPRVHDVAIKKRLRLCAITRMFGGATNRLANSGPSKRGVSRFQTANNRSAKGRRGPFDPGGRALQFTPKVQRGSRPFARVIAFLRRTLEYALLTVSGLWASVIPQPFVMTSVRRSQQACWHRLAK